MKTVILKFYEWVYKKYIYMISYWIIVVYVIKYS